MPEKLIKISVLDSAHRRLEVPEGYYLGMEGENAVNQVKIQFSAALDTSSGYGNYNYYLDILFRDGTKGALPLTLSNGALSATLTSAYLKNGMAVCQVRAVNSTTSTTVWKTTCAEVPIFASVNATSQLTPLPQAEFAIMEALIAGYVDDAEAAQAAAEAAAALAAGVIIDGTYDVVEGTVSLNFPSGTSDYYAYINGLLTAGKTVRLKIKQYLNENWTAMFYYSKSSTPQGDDAFHCFVDREVKDDYSPYGGFIIITADTVSFISDTTSNLQPREITDAGSYFSANTVEGVLQEIGARLASLEA